MRDLAIADCPPAAVDNSSDSVPKVQQKAETRRGHGMLVMFNVTDPVKGAHHDQRRG